MIANDNPMQRPMRALLVGASALLLTIVCLTLLAHFQVRAQTPVEATVPSVIKDVNVSTAAPGDFLTYTVKIQNPDAPATLWMTDTLPPEVTFVPNSLDLFGPGNADFADGVVTWTANSFGFSTMAVVTFSVQVAPDLVSADVVNTAQVTGTGQLFADSAETRVRGGYAGATKSVSPASAKAGDQLVYTVRVTNDGGEDLDTVWMTDVLPSEVSYVPDSATASAGAFGEAGGVLTWSVTAGPSGIQPFPPGGEAAMTFTVRISPDLEDELRFTNTAEITSGGVLVPAHAAATVVTDYRFWIPIFFRNYPPRPVLDSIPEPENHTYTVSWEDIGVSIDHYVLQQSRQVDFTTVEPGGVWTTTLTSQAVDDVYCAFYYRLRVDRSSSWGQGPWSEVQAAQSDPPTPVLNDISDLASDGSYTVSWSAVPGKSVPGVGVDRYVLQESSRSDFSTRTRQWSLTGTSKLVTVRNGSRHNKLYYRVRADDDDCWGRGPWSNTKSTIAPYSDDFSNSNSGWPQREKLVIPSTSTHYRQRYDNGQYRIMIDPGGPPIWFYQPDAFAPYEPPSDKYCVEAQVRFEKNRPPYNNPGWNYYPFWGNAGLIFGANESNSNLYAVCLTVGVDNTLGWFIVNNPTYQFPFKGCNYVQGVVGGEAAGSLVMDAWHKFQVAVNGDEARVYIDGAFKGRWTMSGLAAMTRVGLVGGDYEVTPVDARFDDFKVLPDKSCTP